jgi:hypothetical protein
MFVCLNFDKGMSFACITASQYTKFWKIIFKTQILLGIFFVGLNSNEFYSQSVDIVSINFPIIVRKNLLEDVIVFFSHILQTLFIFSAQMALENFYHNLRWQFQLLLDFHPQVLDDLEKSPY